METKHHQQQRQQVSEFFCAMKDNTAAALVVSSDDKGNPEEKVIEEVRPYQQLLLEASLQRNVIAFLNTGTGKTFIAIMLIKELASQLLLTSSGTDRKWTIFLVNVVPLVEQVKRRETETRCIVCTSIHIV